VSYRVKVHRQAAKELKRLDRTLMRGWSQRPKIILWDEAIPVSVIRRSGPLVEAIRPANDTGSSLIGRTW
jgi:hypothetical protein